MDAKDLAKVFFAPNSSKAYDYAIGNRFGANRIATRNTRYSAIILCDIAPGRKYTTKFNRPDLDGPPTGYTVQYVENVEKTSTMTKLLSTILMPFAHNISYFAKNKIVKLSKVL